MAATKIEEIEVRLTKVEKNRPDDDAVALASTFTEDLKNTDKVLMDQSVKITKIEKILKKMDVNPKDGKVSVKEAVDYARKSVDDVFQIIFIILGSMILATGIMWLRGIIEPDVFYLILQLTTPTGLITAFIKKLMSNMGNKAAILEKKLKELEVEKDQYRIAYELKKKHDEEYKKN